MMVYAIQERLSNAALIMVGDAAKSQRTIEVNLAKINLNIKKSEDQKTRSCTRTWLKGYSADLPLYSL